jgi:integrase
VSVLIPESLASLLQAIKPREGYFFVRGDSISTHTCSDLWRRRFKIICKEAGISPDHPHRTRHTLAKDLLSKGASVEDVAAILRQHATHRPEALRTMERFLKVPVSSVPGS